MHSCLPGDHRTVTPILEQLHALGAVVTRIDPLLLPEECIYLINKAGDFERSETGGGRISNYRTSQTSYPPEPEDDAVVECLAKRLGTIASMPADSLEPLQITTSAHKQRHKQHHDDTNSGDEPRKRLKTIFAYLRADDRLADGSCGGATAFYRLKKDGKPLRIFPKRGSAIMWDNFTHRGEIDYKVVQAGEPVTCPESKKVGLNAWFLSDAPRKRRRTKKANKSEH